MQHVSCFSRSLAATRPTPEVKGVVWSLVRSHRLDVPEHLAHYTGGWAQCGAVTLCSGWCRVGVVVVHLLYTAALVVNVACANDRTGWAVE